MIESREKLIHELEHMAGVINDYDDLLNVDCESWVVLDALELLKEQEAVEPIITPWAEDEDGNIVVAKKECGKCGYQFFTERPNFCENCGTPILWESR